MRIIAGALGGRQFDSPGSHKTHPMSEKARGALFNILGDITGLTVLDPFAGSGALGLEALSRGAASAIIVESDKVAQQTIAANIKTLGLERKATLVQATSNTWFNKNRRAQLDLILCDPPYNDLQEPLIERLGTCLKPTGLLVLSWPANIELARLADLTQIDLRSYGDLRLVFYRKI